MASPLIQSHDAFTQESDPWSRPGNMSFTDTDWNFLSLEDATPYPAGLDGAGADFDIINDPGYGMASTTFSSLSDSGSQDPMIIPPSVVASSTNSQGMRAR